MSKKNLLLGTAAGKVGDLVFYRAGGEQRTRAKVTPNNPRTYAQQAQRSRMANVTLMYRALSALCKDTFTNRKANQTAFNAFSADALPTAPYLYKDKAAEGKFIIAPALVSKGSVPIPWGQIAAQNDGLRVYMNLYLANIPTTVSQLAEALMEWRPCCFQAGGSLVIVMLESPNDEPVDGNRARYIKVPMDVDDETRLDALGITIASQAGTEQNPALTTISIASGAVYFGGTAVVMRPKNGGGYDVSDGRLVLNSDTQQTYEEAITEDAAIAVAASYGGTQGSCVINS